MTHVGLEYRCELRVSRSVAREVKISAGKNEAILADNVTITIARFRTRRIDANAHKQLIEIVALTVRPSAAISSLLGELSP